MMHDVEGLNVFLNWCESYFRLDGCLGGPPHSCSVPILKRLVDLSFTIGSDDIPVHVMETYFSQDDIKELKDSGFILFDSEGSNFNCSEFLSYLRSKR